MRILALASTFPRWANDPTPTFVHRLCVGLKRRGHEVHVLAPHAAGAATTEQMDGLSVHRFRYAPQRAETLAYGAGILENLHRDKRRWRQIPLFMSAELAETVRIVRTEKIDVIHAHWVIPQGLVSAFARPFIECPVVLTAHGGDVSAMTQGFRRRLARMAARNADVCTAVSVDMQRQLKAIADIDAAVIPMGVDPTVFNRAQREDRTRDGQTVLFVGRLVEKKGVRYLVEAMRNVLVSFPQTRLVIVGDGPERDSLQRLAAGMGIDWAVSFKGALPNNDLPHYYRAADIAVVPSITSETGDAEGLPVVLLEAAASGVAIIASRSGGIPEMIEDDRTGLLVTPGDSSAISTAIERLLGDRQLKWSLAESAHEQVIKQSSWDVIAGRYDAIIQNAVKGSPFVTDPS